MTSDQLKQLRETIATNRQPVERGPWSRHEHPRGWNDALDFVERSIKDILGERDDHAPADR
jgi:hypothetical protein